MLRGVDENELLAGAGQDVSLTKSAPTGAKVLDDGDVAALFGLEMAETVSPDTSIASEPRQAQQSQAKKTPKGRKNSRTRRLGSDEKEKCFVTLNSVQIRSNSRSLASREKAAPSIFRARIVTNPGASPRRNLTATAEQNPGQAFFAKMS